MAEKGKKKLTEEELELETLEVEGQLVEIEEEGPTSEQRKKIAEIYGIC